jgi:hypothetical protein
MPTTTARTPMSPTVDGSAPSTAHVHGHLALGAGIGLATAATAAFLAGFAVERELRSRVHDRAVVDALLLRRTAAAAVAWPATTLSAGALAAGAWLLVGDDGDGVAGVDDDERGRRGAGASP